MIGAIEDFGSSCLGALISKFKQTYPRIRFDIRLGTDEMVEELLLHNGIDLGLLVTFKDKSFFDTASLRVDEHILMTSSTYWQERGPFLTYDKILTAELVDRAEDYPCIGV